MCFCVEEVCCAADRPFQLDCFVKPVPLLNVKLYIDRMIDFKQVAVD